MERISPVLIAAYNTEMRLPGVQPHMALLGLVASHATAVSTVVHHCAREHAERTQLVDVVVQLDEYYVRGFVRNEVGR